MVSALVLAGHGAPGAFGGDFIAYYAAGKQILVQGPGQLYVLAQQARFQQPLLAASGLASARPAMIPFNYPAPAALLFLPFALLPARISVALWVGLNLLLVVVSGVVGIGQASPNGPAGSGVETRRALVLLPFLFFPVDWGLLAGQPVGLVLLLGTMLVIGFTRNRPGLAGISLGLLAALKPQLVIGPAIGLLVLGRHRAIAAFAMVGAAMLALTVTLGGVSGIRTYLALLRQMDPVQGNASLAVQASAMVNWRAILVRVPGLDGQAAFLTVLVVAVLTLTLATFISRQYRDRPGRAYLILTVAELLAGYHSHYQDLVLLLPPALAAGWASLDAGRAAPKAISPGATDATGKSEGSVGSRPISVSLSALVVSLALLVVLPGIAWLMLGLLALDWLQVWTSLAIPGLLLLAVALWEPVTTFPAAMTTDREAATFAMERTSV